jgi:ribosomal protein L7/L12
MIPFRERIRADSRPSSAAEEPDMNEALLVGGVIGAAAMAIVFARTAALERRLDALSRLDGKLDALLRHAGIRFDPYAEVPAKVVAALDRGEKIMAIKHYREATGAGLKEAKEFVEEIQRRKGPR